MKKFKSEIVNSLLDMWRKGSCQYFATVHVAVFDCIAALGEHKRAGAAESLCRRDALGHNAIDGGRCGYLYWHRHRQSFLNRRPNDQKNRARQLQEDAARSVASGRRRINRQGAIQIWSATSNVFATSLTLTLGS